METILIRNYEDDFSHVIDPIYAVSECQEDTVGPKEDGEEYQWSSMVELGDEYYACGMQPSTDDEPWVEWLNDDDELRTLGDKQGMAGLRIVFCSINDWNDYEIVEIGEDPGRNQGRKGRFNGDDDFRNLKWCPYGEYMTRFKVQE